MIPFPAIILHYPTGDTVVAGERLSNSVIANRIIDDLTSGRRVSVPPEINLVVGSVGDGNWVLEFAGEPKHQGEKHDACGTVGG